MVTAVIMASGYSTRMGQDKLTLPFKNITIIDCIVDTVLKCEFNQVILVCKKNLLSNLKVKKNLTTIINKNAHLGQSESIKLGVLNSCNCDGYMFFTGDQPLIDTYTINKLLYAFYENKNSIIIPKFKNRKGSPTIFPKDLKEELLTLSGDCGGKIVIQNNLDRVKFVSLQSEYPLFDIDTLENYKRIMKIENEQLRVKVDFS